MRVGQTGEKTGETNIIDETDITFYLVPKGDEGELHPDPDPEEKESFFEYTYFPDKPVPAIGGNGIGIPSSGQRVQTSIEEREDVCVYVSEVLAEDVLVVGVVKVEVVLQCFSYREGVSAKREITLIARGMKLTRLCSHAPVLRSSPRALDSLSRSQAWTLSLGSVTGTATTRSTFAMALFARPVKSWTVESRSSKSSSTPRQP